MSKAAKAALWSAALIALPAICLATDRVTSAAVQNCSQAVASSLTGESNTSPRLVGTDFLDTGLLNSQSNRLTLTARDPRNQRIVAQMICSYDQEGNVVRLEPAPLGGSLSYSP